MANRRAAQGCALARDRLPRLTRSGGQGQSSADIGRGVSASDMLLHPGIGGWQRIRWYEDARHPVVQGRSLSGLSSAQMWVIRSPATSNAYTVTVRPSCWATRPG